MKGNRQAFSTIEYKARLQRVQAEMRRRDIPVLLLHSPENIYYLSGYQTSGYFAYQVLIVTEAEEPTLLVRFLERGNVDEYAWLSHDETWREGDDVIVRTVEAIRGVADDCRSIGIERSCWFLTVEVAEGLAHLLPNVRFVDASQLVDRIRLIKSEAEVRYIRQAADITERQIRVALDAAHHGATEAELAAATLHAGILAGGEYTGLPCHFMSGYRYNVCHGAWTPKVISRGELVLIEIYSSVERYHATQIRTICVGAPAQKHLETARLVIEAQDMALAAMRPGASSRDIDAMVRHALRKIRGEYYNRSGYSTGIGFPPRTAEWQTLDFNEQTDWELQEGMVFHMLALAEGFGVSETVVVTTRGIERLTHSNPRALLATDA